MRQDSIPLYPPLRDKEITVSFTDRTGQVIRKFADVDELARFFKDNPQVAREFGYVRKDRKEDELEEKKPDPVRETMMRFLNGETVLKGYATEGVHQAASKFLIEKTSMGWVRTDAGKKYLAKLEKGLL